MADKFKVLMIDDEKDIVGFFSATFKNFPQVQFIKAFRAIEGIEIAKKERPDVILIDLRMPEMNGEEALVELKKDLPDTKYVVMTGWDEGETKRHIEQDIGVSAYFQKPVDLEKVISKVMSLLMVKE